MEEAERGLQVAWAERVRMCPWVCVHVCTHMHTQVHARPTSVCVRPVSLHVASTQALLA